MEYTIIILSREDEVILAVFLHDIIVPHLLLSPLHLLHIKDLAVIGDLTIHHIIHGNHMVILHLEVTAVVIESSTSLPVMRRIDIKASVKHIGRRICIIITRE